MERVRQRPQRLESDDAAQPAAIQREVLSGAEGAPMKREHKLDAVAGSSRQVAQQARIEGFRSGRPASTRGPAGGAEATPPLADAPTVQRREIDMGTHGRLEIGDFASGLSPDDPSGYGGGTGLLGDTVASSMDMLVTPNHPKGSSPADQDHLFSQLPTKGDYKLPANSGRTKDGSTLYIKGHLLNDNLGGPGRARNLYPITHQANVDHNNLVEEPIKEWVNQRGGIVRYRVTPIFKGDGNSGVAGPGGGALSYVNADFSIDVSALTMHGAVQVASGKIIASRWGAAVNAGAISFSGTPLVAPQFNAATVHLPPRKQVKQEWEHAYVQIAAHLAAATGVSLEKWAGLHLSGVGKKSVELLQSQIDYTVLSKSGKATLTKARGILKAFIDSEYGQYLRVNVSEQALDEATDQGVAPEDLVTPDAMAVAQSVSDTSGTIDELESLIDELGRLSLGPDDSVPDTSAPTPPFGHGLSSSFSSSEPPPRRLPPECVQGEAFKLQRDYFVDRFLNEPTNIDATAMAYIKLVLPRVNKFKAAYYLNHATRVMRGIVGTWTYQGGTNNARWRRLTREINTVACYYEATFPEGVWNLSPKND